MTAELGADAAVTFDAINETVFIRADADTIRRAKDVAAELDERRRADCQMTAVYLKRASAGDVAVVLKMLLIFQRVMGDDRSASGFAPEKGNYLLLTGNKEKTDALVAMIRALDARCK